MLLRLQEIKPRGVDEYEVILTDGQGGIQCTVCRVIQRNGSVMVTMQPDLVMPRWAGDLPRVDSGELVVAVLEHHRRSQEDLALAR